MYARGQSDGGGIPGWAVEKLNMRKIAAKYGQPPHFIETWPTETVIFETNMLKYDAIAEQARNGNVEDSNSPEIHPDPYGDRDWDPNDYPELNEEDNDDYE